jgi:signal transduction histidine kinase
MNAVSASPLENPLKVGPPICRLYIQKSFFVRLRGSDLATDRFSTIRSTMPAGNRTMIQLRDSRWMNLATYVTVSVMYVVGAMGLPDWGLRLAAAGLCLAFGAAYALLFGRLNSERQAAIYLVIQAALVAGLLALRTSVGGAFNFLFFILSIQAALILPGARAAGWALFFFVLSSLTDSAVRGSASLAGILFNAPVYFICIVFGQNLRATELARRHNEELLEELRAAQHQLRELAIVEERNRIAREMHDSLGHRLTVAVVQLEGAQRLIPIDADRASRMIGAMRDEMKDALAELRRTVAALRANPEPDLPLETAVSELAQTFQQNTGLLIHFSPPPDFPALPDSYRLAFYRAAQESLTNVQRHAGARNIWLKLEAAGAEICLTVEDDGRGFADGDLTSNSILRGLHERAAILGGQLQVANRPGGGAQIIFSAPRPATHP